MKVFLLFLGLAWIISFIVLFCVARLIDLGATDETNAEVATPKVMKAKAGS